MLDLDYLLVDYKLCTERGPAGFAHQCLPRAGAPQLAHSDLLMNEETLT